MAFTHPTMTAWSSPTGNSRDADTTTGTVPLYPNADHATDQ